jgi:hypothetical protein
MPIKSWVLRSLVISIPFQLAFSVGAVANAQAGAEPPGFGTPIAVQPAAGNAFGALVSMTSDGTNFLLAAQQFPGSPPVAPTNTPPSLVGTLLAPSGLVLSRIFLSLPSTGELGQQLVFDGTNYLFTGAAGGVFLSASGVLLQGPENGQAGSSAPFALASNGAGNLIATNGSEFVGSYETAVVYSETVSGTSSPNPIVGSGGSEQFALASDGTNYLCLCGVGATLLDGFANLVQSAPLPLVAVSDGGSEVLAFGGGGYLVVWTQASSTQGLTTIAALRLSASGVPIDTKAIAVTVDPSDVSNVGVSFFDGQFWIVWQSGSPSAVYAALVSPNGSVTSAGPDGVMVAASAANPILSTNATAGVLAWNSINGSDITGVQVRSISPIQ